MNDLNAGWMGDPNQLLYVLGTYGAEKDADGKFMVFGEPPFFGLDGDVVISARVECRINGNRVPVASLMNGTSYGLRNVTVI